MVEKTMTDLTTRLEQASGPDRVLDAHIEYRVNHTGELTHVHKGGWFNVCWQVDGLTGFSSHYAREYTGSIDASVSLFDELPAMVSSNPIENCIAALKAIEEGKDDG